MKPIHKFYGNNNGYQGAGHPAYGFAEVDDKTFYLDITHSEYVQNKRNSKINYKYHKLTKNPNPLDSENSYISPFPYSVKTEKLKNEKKDWNFDEKDLSAIEKYKNKKIH